MSGGFGADGSKEDVIAFLAISHRFGKLTIQEKESLQRYLFAFPTETAPIVGFTRTVNAANAKTRIVKKDLELLIAQAELGKCDPIVQGVFGKRQVRFVYDTARKSFTRDTAGFEPMTRIQLTSALSQDNSVVTFLGVAAGNGNRLGIDRDANGKLDGDKTGGDQDAGR